MINRVQRISVAVASMDDALMFYRDALGLTVVAEIELPERDLRLVRLRLGEVEIELMEPTNPDSPVGEFIERHGPGLHHISLNVDDIEAEMRTLMARNVGLIDREPRPGPQGRIGWVNPHSTGGVLVELFEAATPPPDLDAAELDVPGPDVNEGETR